MPAIHDRAKVNGDDVAFLQRALPRHAMHDLFIDRGADDASEWRCTLGGRVALEIRGRATAGKLACGQGIEFTRRHAWLRRRAQDLQNLHHHQACLPDTLDLSFTAIVDCHTLLRLPRAHVTLAAVYGRLARDGERLRALSAVERRQRRQNGAPYLVYRLRAIHAQQLALRRIEIEQLDRLREEDVESPRDLLRRIISALIQLASITIAYAGNFRRFGLDIPDMAMRAADVASAQPLEQQLAGNLQIDDVINLATGLCEARVELFGLCDSAWEAIENNAFRAE